MTTPRLMFVHAHPDDESSQTGATLARYCDEGAAVTLVTCTLGELGEILDADISARIDAGATSLAAVRLGELAEAMAVLGVTDFVRLGGDGRYHDSGMSYTPEGDVVPLEDLDPRAFASADLLSAADDLVEIIRARRPHVIVTYNPFGGYAHPDHVMAHRVTMYADLLAGVASHRRDLGDPWTAQRVLWSTMAADDLRLGVRLAKQLGVETMFADMPEDASFAPMGAETADLAAAVATGAYAERKRDALAAYRSQVDVGEPFWQFVLSSPPGSFGESYLMVRGEAFPHPGSVADDLVAGLDLLP